MYNIHVFVCIYTHIYTHTIIRMSYYYYVCVISPGPGTSLYSTPGRNSIEFAAGASEDCRMRARKRPCIF